MTPAMLERSQDDFVRALLDPALPVPARVTSISGPRPKARFDVYRNNVVAGLGNALRARFPAVERIVGDEFFAAAARVFVTAQPPRSKLLMEYGDGFPEFLAAFPPAADLPYLADVARLEAARTRAYHAADAEPLDAGALAALDPEQLWSARLVLHPSAQVLRFSCPAVTIWAMNAGEAELAPVDFGVAEDALAIRPRFEVAVHRLPPGGAAFLLALQSGAPLGTAAEAAAADSPNFDLTGNLAGILQAGALSAMTVPQDKE